MAFGDVFGNLKQKVRSVYNNFFYDGAQAPAPQAPVYQQEQPYQQPQEQPYQQPVYQQAPFAPQTEYAQPQQPAYQAPVYQQPQEQQYQQPRNRRMQQHAEQNAGNVVDFGAYQQQAQQPAYQQPAYQQPMQPEFQQEAPQQNVLANARVINARGMGDCRSAITLLRNGDAVLIVLENVTDPSELRRLVDTLSGACYSLTATITKVSRYGVYLLAPQSMAVYTDQATSQMNNPGRTMNRSYQAGLGAQRAYQQPQQPQSQGFTQRSAQVDEPQQPFYARTAPQAAQVPSFSTQPVAYGYVADELEAAAEQ